MSESEQLRELIGQQVGSYTKDVLGYQQYADFLRRVLEAACGRLVTEAMVQCRAKSLSSFAEKVVRKRKKFAQDEHYHFTDLCGARIICQTSSDKALMCEYLRNSPDFLIDQANSLDVKSRLHEDAFGYLSVHFVVQISAGLALIEGHKVPPEVKRGEQGFKAEIQVRTMLEHVWATTLHDRLYKAGIQVPPALRREAAALAALVEGGDERFLKLTGTLDAYLGQYTASLDKQRYGEERAALLAAREALAAGPGQAGKPNPKRQHELATLSLKLARLARSNDDLEQAVADLGDWKQWPDLNPALSAAVRVERGHALCLLHRGKPWSRQFLAGQKLLETVANQDPDDRGPALSGLSSIRAEACRVLGWSISRTPRTALLEADWYTQGLELDPDNPYLLAASLSLQVYRAGGAALPASLRGTVRRTIAVCREHAMVGVEVPRAYLAIGRLHLLLLERREALCAYLKAMALLLAPSPEVPVWILEDELDFLESVDAAHRPETDTGLVYRLLTLALAIRDNTKDRLAALGQTMPNPVAALGTSNHQVLMVAGGAALESASCLARCREVLSLALNEFEGVVISGGTSCGVPGLVAETVDGLAGTGEAPRHLLGYLARSLAHDCQEDERYTRHGAVVTTRGHEFSELEPVQAWIDLVAAGFGPEDVRLLGFGGGPIAAFEYRLALALGARVGIVEGTGRAADDLLHDPDWPKDDYPNLVPLPPDMLDRATLRAFVHQGSLPIDPTTLDVLAEQAHQQYLARAPYSEVDPSHRRFAELRADLKDSNRQQVLYAATILASLNYRVRPLREGEQPLPPPDFGNEEAEAMAELEHGRWNIERLAAGWRPGRKKDAVARINDCLLTWDQLKARRPEAVVYDREAVRGYAQLLSQAGLVVEREEPQR